MLSKNLKFMAVAGAMMFGNHCFGITPAEVRFHNEASDTTKIISALNNLSNSGIKGQALVAAAGEYFLNVPYVSGSLEGSPEQLTVNTEELDCTTFVETALALAMCIENRRDSWRDYINYLESIRYRGGKVNGYASRLHYISEWVVDNTHRGILKEVTDRVGKPTWQIKTLDFMSAHRDAYAALSDSTNFADIKRIESGYRGHRFAYIKESDAVNTQFQDGDIVAMTTKTAGLDVSHVGIIKIIDGKAHLLHASSKAKRVVVEKLTVAEYMKRNRTQGIRVIRLAD